MSLSAWRTCEFNQCYQFLGRTLEDSEVLNFLKLYNSGGKPDIMSKPSFN
jgi:hypothetical protein